MTERVRVLIVDDSAFARKVLRESLQSHPSLEVVGVARDGLEAIELIAEHDPHVVTLDLVMPGLDGIGLLRSMTPAQRARVVVVSTSAKDTELGVEALTLGAFDLVVKPTAIATDRLYGLAQELTLKVLRAGERHRALAPSLILTVPAAVDGDNPVRVVAVGASTGGPAALMRFISALPADLSVPVVIALHIMPGYTDSLAARLDRASSLHVVEAHHGIALTPGVVVLARGGQHLKIVAVGDALQGHIPDTPATLHRPSVDLLFESAAVATGAGALGIVLTGMGEDGLQGARAIVAAGGTIAHQSEDTCIVFGMPRAVAHAGLSSAALRLDDIATWVARTVKLREPAGGGPVARVS